jgi:hypothetical protein
MNGKAQAPGNLLPVDLRGGAAAGQAPSDSRTAAS